MPWRSLQLAVSNNGNGKHLAGAKSAAKPKIASDQFPYRVELWDEDRSQVEQVLAIVANSDLAYTFFYETIRKYPDRKLTLRLKDRVVHTFPTGTE